MGRTTGGLSRKHLIRRHRRLAPPPRRRLRRPLPDPPLRLRHADRGNARSAARHRQGGEGALHRRIEHVRVAVHEDARRVGRARLDAVRVDAEPLQPRLPRGGARDAAALPRRRHRRHPVEPAGARLPGRQPPRRADRGETVRAPRPTTSRTSCITPTPTSRRRSGGRSWRRGAGSSRRRWRWPGCWRSLASPRRSSARRSCRTSTRRSARST